MVDPIKNLPKEVNSSLFSLLSTTQIALCNAVSKDWRFNLLNDSIVNRVLDLSRIRGRLTEDQIINLVSRLASNSSNPQRELLLDVTPFFKSFQECDKLGINRFVGELIRQTLYKFPILIHTISSATRGQLSKLSLSAYTAGPAPSYLTIAVIETTLLLKEPIEGLREINFSIPSLLSLVSEGPKETDGRSPRRIELTGHSVHPELQWEIEDCLWLIRESNGFTKGNLVSLELPNERNRRVGSRIERLNELRGLINIIQESKNTLNYLRLGVIVEQEDFDLDPQPGYVVELWNLVKSLSKLEELDFYLYPEGFSEDPGDQLQSIVNLILPQGNDHEVLKLKSLTFSLASATLEWEVDPLHWFGSSLETLYLRFGSDEMHFGVIPEIPSIHLASFLNLQSNLKSLELEHLFTSDPDPEVTIDLPNLEDLDLNFLNLKSHQIFTNASLPSLETLRIQFPDSPDPAILGQDESGLCLPILTATRLSLASLTFRGSLGTLNSSLQEPILFPHLRSLTLNETSSNIFELFGKFQYEKLFYLSVSGESVKENVLFDFLASCSSTLKTFWPNWIMPMEEASDMDRSQSLSFPNYTDLNLNPQVSFLFNLFSHATLPNLRSLRFTIGNDLKALVTFLGKTFTNLERLSVESCDSTSKDISQDIESFRDIKISLPALKSLSISDCPSALVQFLFSYLSFSGITNFTLNISDSISSELQTKILEFMLKESSTLKQIRIRRSGFDVDENEVGQDDNEVKMRKLKWLEVTTEGNCSKFMNRLLTQFRFPQLETLVISDLNEDQESKTQRDLWKSSLKVIAPQLERFSIDGRRAGRRIYESFD